MPKLLWKLYKSEKFHGIGQVTATKMHELGIRTGADLKELKLAQLTQHFGKAGHYYYKIARGQDDRAVEPNRIRKSIGAETSFAKDLSDRAQMLLELEQIAQTVKLRLDQHQTYGRTLTLKVKFSDYQQITRSKTVLTPIKELSAIAYLAKELFEAIELSDVSRQAQRESKFAIDGRSEPLRCPGSPADFASGVQDCDSLTAPS